MTDAAVEECAAMAADILTGLGGTPFVPSKEALKPAEKLFSYARAILRRQTSAGKHASNSKLVDVCTADAALEVLSLYFTEETVADLKSLTIEEFVSAVKPEHKSTATVFSSMFQQCFADAQNAKDLGSEFTPLPPTLAGIDVHNKRVMFDVEDSMYTVDCSTLFTSRLTPLMPVSQFLPIDSTHEIFSRDAVLRLLSKWQVSLADVKSISFAKCGLADADIPELQLLVDGAECARIDLSFNHFVTFADGKQREWLVKLLDVAQVVLIGSGRLLFGDTCLLLHVASCAPEKLRNIIWLGASRVYKKRLWRKELGDSVTDVIVDACVEAHVRYFAELGEYVDSDSEEEEY